MTLDHSLHLRTYQETAVERLLAGNLLLADEPGVGKTAAALVAAKAIGGRVLIIAPGSALGVWHSEAERWLGITPARYYGLHRDDESLDEDVVVANYAALTSRIKIDGGDGVRRMEVVQNDAILDRHWDLVIMDEAHRLKNRRAKSLFVIAKRLKTNRIWLLTGSPVVGGVADVWPLLHLIDPAKWSSYWAFVKQYANVENLNVKGRVVLKVEGGRNLKALRAELEGYMLRRLKSEVLSELPAKTRQAVPLELEGRQLKAYSQMEKAMLVELDTLNLDTASNNWMMAPGILAQFTRLRQLLVTPRILGIQDDGAALTALAEEAEGLDEPIVVFCPYEEGLQYIATTLEKTGYRVVGAISHKVTPDKIAKMVADFQGATDERRVLLSTIRMGTSWTATAAQTAYFVGQDWTPANCGQSEDRLHRMGQKGNVTVRYLVHAGTIDEHVLDVIDGKITVSRMLLDHATSRQKWLKVGSA